MPKEKTRIDVTTNPIVTVVTLEDDEHCNAIVKMAKQLGQRYRFVILKENEPFSSVDRKAYPSSFVIRPKFIVNKSHHNWSKTHFDFCYVNDARRGGKKLVQGGTRNLLTHVTPLRLRQMLELLLVFVEIEEVEDMTYRRGRRSKEPTDSKCKSKYFTTLRLNVTVLQLCRLLETIEAALDEEDIEMVRILKAKKIMEQWEDHILEGSWRRKREKTKGSSDTGS